MWDVCHYTSCLFNYHPSRVTVSFSQLSISNTLKITQTQAILSLAISWNPRTGKGPHFPYTSHYWLAMSSYKDSHIAGFSHKEVAALFLTAICVISHGSLAPRTGINPESHKLDACLLTPNYYCFGIAAARAAWSAEESGKVEMACNMGSCCWNTRTDARIRGSRSA